MRERKNRASEPKNKSNGKSKAFVTISHKEAYNTHSEKEKKKKKKGKFYF